MDKVRVKVGVINLTQYNDISYLSRARDRVERRAK
jgi:hypothetical protein